MNRKDIAVCISVRGDNSIKYMPLMKKFEMQLAFFFGIEGNEWVNECPVFGTSVEENISHNHILNPLVIVANKIYESYNCVMGHMTERMGSPGPDHTVTCDDTC